MCVLIPGLVAQIQYGSTNAYSPFPLFLQLMFDATESLDVFFLLRKHLLEGGIQTRVELWGKNAGFPVKIASPAPF